MLPPDGGVNLQAGRETGVPHRAVYLEAGPPPRTFQITVLSSIVAAFGGVDLQANQEIGVPHRDVHPEANPQRGTCKPQHETCNMRLFIETGVPHRAVYLEAGRNQEPANIHQDWQYTQGCSSGGRPLRLITTTR